MPEAATPEDGASTTRFAHMHMLYDPVLQTPQTCATQIRKDKLAPNLCYVQVNSEMGMYIQNTPHSSEATTVWVEG